MSHPALIYARFSSLEQGKGHSLKRQLQRARQHIHKMRWEYPTLDPDIEKPDFNKGAPDRDFTDEGKSAYSGANRQPGGQLHEIERKAKLGHYRNGAILVVENLDRFTRQGWEEAVAILRTLTENGMSVATVHNEKLFRAGEKIEVHDIMMVIIEADLAFKESDKKSKRLLASWEDRVQNIVNGDKKALTKVPPMWINVDPKTYAMSLNSHRAAVLNEIYERYVGGWGLPKIVQMLNERGEPSWAYGKKNTGAGWNTAYIHKLLTNRAVMGEFKPMSRSHGGIVETSKGIIVPDYFPQAISADLFQRAQAHRSTRAKFGGGQVNKLSNLFAGLVVCAHCNAPMYFQSQQRKGRKTNHKLKDGTSSSWISHVDRSYLMCNNRRRSNKVKLNGGEMGQCPNSGKPRYEHIETAILDTVLNLAMDNVSFSMPDRVAELEVQLAEHERLTDGKRHKLGNLHNAIAEAFSTGLATMAAALENEIKADIAHGQALQKELDREKGQASPEEHFERVKEVRASLHSEDEEARYEARLRVMQTLRQVVRMSCDQEGITTVRLTSGLMAWRFDKNGNQVGEPVDLRNRLDLHKGLVSGELEDNADHVQAVLRRSA